MYQKKQLNEIIEKLFEDIEFEKEPRGLYDPLRYMIEIGGKRIRPKVCLLTYSLFKDTIDDSILSPCAALEVFHTFTLIHDDIMDRSPLRRGMPTVWKKWSEDHAILSGDVMLIDAYKRISKVPSKRHNEVMRVFSDTSAAVCEGQQYDMDFEAEESVPMADYNKMIGLKTAVLIACSAKIGAIVADMPEVICAAIYNYGYELGMAFQVADDYLDAYGDEKVFGKPIGGDIINAKKSWLTVRALEKTDDKDGFLKAFESKAETPEEMARKIAKVKSLYDELGVADDARAEIVRFTDRALDAVSGVGLSKVQIAALKEFADTLVGRAK